MKALKLGVLVLLAAAPALSGELVVTITGIKKPTGTVLVTLKNSEAAWNSDTDVVAVQKIAAQKAVETKGMVVLNFGDLPAGTYAVMVLHDENDNRKMDTGVMGIPSEAYGFSNNPHVMRKPYFSETKFEVGAATVNVAIQLH
jgi:uncharacterized protein (DUF2141 family)